MQTNTDKGVTEFSRKFQPAEPRRIVSESST